MLGGEITNGKSRENEAQKPVNKWKGNEDGGSRIEINSCQSEVKGGGRSE